MSEIAMTLIMMSRSVPLGTSAATLLERIKEAHPEANATDIAAACSLILHPNESDHK